MRRKSLFLLLFARIAVPLALASTVLVLGGGCSKDASFYYEDSLSDLTLSLSDPDEGIYSQIRDRIVSLGSPVVPVLERAWETDDLGDLFRNRIEDILHTLPPTQPITDNAKIKLRKLGPRNATIAIASKMLGNDINTLNKNPEKKRSIQPP